MYQDEFVRITELDRITTQPRLQMLKATIPYLPPQSQRLIALMAKFQELNTVMRRFQETEETLSICEVKPIPENPMDILDDIKQYGSPEDQNSINYAKNVVQAMSLYRRATNQQGDTALAERQSTEAENQSLKALPNYGQVAEGIDYENIQGGASDMRRNNNINNQNRRNFSSNFNNAGNNNSNNSSDNSSDNSNTINSNNNRNNTNNRYANNSNANNSNSNNSNANNSNVNNSNSNNSNANNSNTNTRNANNRNANNSNTNNRNATNRNANNSNANNRNANNSSNNNASTNNNNSNTFNNNTNNRNRNSNFRNNRNNNNTSNDNDIHQQDLHNDPTLQQMDPKKLSFLMEMLNEANNNKSSNDMMPLLLSMATRSNQSGIQFTDEETKTVLNVLKQRMSPEEQSRMDMLLNASRMFSNNSGGN